MFNSIRIRLTLWYLSILALIIIAFAFGTYFLIERNSNQRINENLAEIGGSIEKDLHREETDLVAERLQQKPDAEKEKKKTAEPDEDKADTAKDEVTTIEGAIVEEVADLRFDDYGFVVLDQNGQQIASNISDEKLQNELKNLSTDAQFVDISHEKQTFRVYCQSMTLDGKRFQLFTTLSIQEQAALLANLREIFFIAVPIALLLAGLGGYFLAKRSLKSVVLMSNQAEKISSTNLDERLPVKNENDELGGLAKVFNSLLARLESSFGQQRRFMADASHELRTPLAIVRTESEVAISKDNRTADEYRESLTVIHEESKHLTNIVEDLFLLTRADSGQLRPEFANIYLDEVLLESVRAISVLAEKQNIKIEHSVFAKMPLKADESLLHRLFLNLLDNAVKYNRTDGKVSIETEIGEKNYRITIRDTGTGIAAEDQAKIFERFYRIDKARSSKNTENTSGAGLGLSISVWIAEIHQGSVTLQKSDAEGSIFVVELPK